MKIKRFPTWALMACAAVPLQSLSQTAQGSTLGAPPASAPTQTLPDGSPVFPDRRPGNPHTLTTPPPLQLGNHRVGVQELGYESSERTRRLDWRVQYGRREGVGLGLNYARLINDRWAWGVNGNAGPDHLDLVVNGLYSLTPQWHLGGSLGYLDRTDAYSFLTGPGEASASQLSHRLSLQRSFDKDQVLSDLGLQVYGARVLRTKSAEHVVAEETATEMRWWLDPRRLAPGRLTGWGAVVGLRPWEGGRLRVALGTERVNYAYQDGTGSRESRATSSVDLRQRLSACWFVDAGLKTGVASNQWRFGVGRGTWSLAVNHASSRQDGPGTTTVALTMNLPLGGSGATRCADTEGTPREQIRFDRLEQVYRRPVELPITILAKVDPTARPYLLASFDKAGLNGAKVSVTPDALIVTLPGPVQSVAMLAIGGQPASNVGLDGTPLLAAENGALRLAIRQFPNPGAGVIQPVDAVLVMQDGTLTLVSFNVVGH